MNNEIVTISDYWLMLPISLIVAYVYFSYLSEKHLSGRIEHRTEYSGILFFVYPFASLITGLGAVVSLGCILYYKNHMF